MMWFAIASIIVEIIKLIIMLRKNNPTLVAECKAEMVAAEKGKKLDKLQEILAKLKAAAQK